MAFGFLKKKEDDGDFGSDMGPALGPDPLASPGEDKSLSDSMPAPHMGLPLDGNMTNTAPPGSPSMSDPMAAANQAGDPFAQQAPPPPLAQQGSASAPSAFSQLNQMSHQTGDAMPQGAPGAPPGTKIALVEKDVQLLNAKVDAIKIVLEAINTRLSHIEKIAESSQSKEEVIHW